MNEIGPNIEVENRSWRVKIGPNLQLKRLEGIYEIHMLLYQSKYPSQETVIALKEEFANNSVIQVSDLIKKWDLSKDQIEYYLAKLIENGFLRADLENGNLIKK